MIIKLNNFLIFMIKNLFNLYQNFFIIMKIKKIIIFIFINNYEIKYYPLRVNLRIKKKGF